LKKVKLRRDARQAGIVENLVQQRFCSHKRIRVLDTAC
jgi:hypothetical protein